MATYYVSMSGGNNANNGLSISAPFRNLCAFATSSDSLPSPLSATNFLKPGDTVKLKRGDEWVGLDAQWNVESTGSASGYITFEDYGTGAKPLFTGGRTAASLGLNTWTLYSGNIYYTTNVTWEVRGACEDGTKPLWLSQSRFGGLNNMVAGSCFWSSSQSRLYVWCSDGLSPSQHTIYIFRHPTDDNFRGLVKVKKGGGGSHIIFRNIHVRMSNTQGFSSSGEYQFFYDCKAEFCARDGFYFIKNAVTAPGAQYNEAHRCEAHYNVLAGGGFGQGFTGEAPYNKWNYCTANNNGMAGFDLLDYNTSTDVQFCEINYCQAHNNGRSPTTLDNFDAGIYLDGCSNCTVFSCITSGAGMNTIYDAPGISIDVEPLGYSNGKRANNNKIINCLVYNCRGEMLRIGQITGQNGVMAVDNALVIGNTFHKTTTTGGEGMYVRATNFTFKNNVVQMNANIPLMFISNASETEPTMEMDNNVLYNPGSTAIVSLSGTTKTITEWRLTPYFHDLLSSTSNPLLTNTSSTAFNARVAAGSPAIDLADETVFPFQFRGTAVATNASDTWSNWDAGYHYEPFGTRLSGIKLTNVRLT